MIQSIPHHPNDIRDEDRVYREVLETRFAHVKEKADALRAQIERQQVDLRALDDESSHLAALLGIAGSAEIPVTRRESPTGPPRGVADLVVQLIGEEGPLHYRKIYDRFIARGWEVPSGVDPANGLLARYFNDERLHRPRRGTYALTTPSTSTSAARPRRAL